jgi:arylsulfatase A-like enzyme
LLAGLWGCDGDRAPGATPRGLVADSSVQALPSGAEAIDPCVSVTIPEVPENANVVLIVNDTARRDKMGLHGGTAQTPHFDQFARQNHYFSAAASVSPWTKPSVASLFTSLAPSRHGVLDDPRRRTTAGAAWSRADGLSDGFETMAEILRRWGFRTGAIVTNPWLETKFGFAQGFDDYRDRSADWGIASAEVTREAIEWLDANADERFFLYVHYMGGHRPYGLLEASDIARAREQGASDPRRFTGVEGAVLDMLRYPEGMPLESLDPRPGPALVDRAYDRGLEDFDGAFGQLLDALRASPSWQRTVVIVTSDHGEALFERGWGNHGRSFFEEEVGIPLAFRLPGVVDAPGEVACPVSLLDVLPTLCEYLDIRCPEAAEGISWMAGADEPTPRYLRYEANIEGPENRAVRSARYKLIYEPFGPTRLDGGRPDRRREQGVYLLFDLEEDPLERHDLLASPTPEAQAIGDALAAELHGVPVNTAAPVPSTAASDPELRDRREALGYAR